MRQLALGLVLFAALAAPFALASPADAALRPVKLQLISLECTETNDIGVGGVADKDEAVLQVGTQVVFGPQDIDDGETVDLGLTKKFRRTVQVTLIDEDVTSPDDILGTVTIRRGEAGDGVQQASFQDNGADYTLTYKVVN